MVDKPADTLFTSNERASLESLAQQRGFKSAREYVLALAAHDATQHGEAFDIAADDELDDPAESFRRAWDDAMNGRVMSWEEFQRQMQNDAD